MAKPLSLAIYLPNLNGGGAERLQINLASYFLAQNVDVTFVLDRAEGILLDQIPSDAKPVVFNNKRTMRSVPSLARYLHQKRPDILLSNLSHNNVVALVAKKLALVDTKVIVCQHNAMSSEAVSSKKKFGVIPTLYRAFLPLADGIVAVSQGVADDMVRVARMPASAITTIRNGAITPDFDVRAAEPVQHPWLRQRDTPTFVALGRLVEQKDFSTLIHALAECRKTRDVRLVILGEGKLLNSLTQLAGELNVEDHVSLPGYTLNPFPSMRAASAVVLSSIHEGFANVLAEALACGTPVVSTDCPEGPREILENGVYGRLTPVGDYKAMATAMLATLDDAPRREQLQERGREFSVATCGQRYMELFQKVLAKT
jgi:glycosyltransferase involved in cell wall biosynthesis